MVCIAVPNTSGLGVAWVPLTFEPKDAGGGGGGGAGGGGGGGAGGECSMLYVMNCMTGGTADKASAGTCLLLVCLLQVFLTCDTLVCSIPRTTYRQGGSRCVPVHR